MLIVNILVSKHESCGNKNLFKYLTGYNDNDNIRPLQIKLPQMTGYVRKFDGNAKHLIFYNKRQLKG